MERGRYVLALLRISLGFIFVWAFFDKLFGLGFATQFGKAWINGVSPTFGFLKFGTTGPLAPIYQLIAGNIIVDVLFMLGLLLIGFSLLLGIATRLAGYSGALLMFLLWTVFILPETNQIIDNHIIYLFLLILLAQTDSGKTFGFGKSWEKTNLVKKLPFLK